MGPTGTGKSAVAEALAEQFDAQLVNADAFQVYRGFDIGTNKPGDPSRYALIDILDPSEPFSVGAWLGLAVPVVTEAWRAGRSVIVVGGTGLYVRALMDEYDDLGGEPDPDVRARVAQIEAAEGLPGLVRTLTGIDPETQVDLANPVRVRRALERRLSPSSGTVVKLPPYRKVKVACDTDPETHNVWLLQRQAAMFEAGWLNEVTDLLEKGVPRNAPAMRAIGYQSLVRLTDGLIDRRQAEGEVQRDTRRYAKRQRTWLRRERGLRAVCVGIGNNPDTGHAIDSIAKLILSQGEK